MAIPTCRLPVSRPQVQPSNPYFVDGYIGGFLELPAGQYADDPRGTAVLDPDAPGGRAPIVYMSAATPVLRGSDAILSPPAADMTYDPPMSRWLPVPRSSISSDGTRYAYVDELPTSSLPTSRVHIVTVKTGAEKVLQFPDPDLAQITPFLPGLVAFTRQGIYLSLSGSNEGSGPDTGKLWLLDPDRGTIRKVTDVSGRWLVTDTYAWTIVATAGSSSFANRLMRLDLSSGQLDQWWVDANYEPVSSQGAASGLSVMGLDAAGSPIVEGVGEVGNGQTYTYVFDMWVIKAANQAVAVDVSAADGGDAGAPITSWDGVLADSVGTWISLNKHLFLYARDGTFQKVADGPYSPAGSCS